MEKLDYSSKNVTQTQFDIQTTVTQIPFVVSATRQYISSLNRTPKLQPGVFLIKPVVLLKQTMALTPSQVRVDYVSSGRSAYIAQSGPVIACGVRLDAGGPSTFGRPSINTDAKFEALATINAFAKMNASAFDGGVFLGELAETIHMLRHPIAGIVKHLQKRRWRNPVNVAKAGSDAWMEFRYGIRPMVSDVSNIANLFNKKVNGTNRFIHASRVSVPSSMTWVGDTDVGVGKLLYHLHHRGTRKTTYHVGLSYKKKINISSVAHQYGVGVQDMPNVLWELTPMSFVADWFINVGDWLRAITPNPAVSYLGGFISRKTDEIITSHVTNVSYGSYTGLPSGMATCHVQQLSRTLCTGIPALPVRKISTLGLARSIDSVILLLQRIPRVWR